MSADEIDLPTPVVSLTLNGIELIGSPESDVTLTVNGLNPDVSTSAGRVGRGRIGARRDMRASGAVTITLLQTAPNNALLSAHSSIPGVGAIRVGHRLLYREVGYAYREDRQRRLGYGKWIRALGIPNHLGIGNRHDFVRWCKRVLALACTIAHDAMLDDRRDLALAALCVVVPLATAVSWTEVPRGDKWISYPTDPVQMERIATDVVLRTSHTVIRATHLAVDKSRV